MGVSLLCTAAVIIIVVHSNGRIHIHFAPVSRFGHAISIALEPRSLAGDVSCKADINGPISLRRCIVSLFDGFMQFGKGADIEPSDICILRRICEDTGGRNHDRCNEHYGDEQRHYLADFSCLHNYHLSFDFCTGLVRMAYGAFFLPFYFPQRRHRRCRNCKGIGFREKRPPLRIPIPLHCNLILLAPLLFVNTKVQILYID